MKTFRDHPSLWLAGLVLFLAMATLGWNIGKGNPNDAEAPGITAPTQSKRKYPSTRVRRARESAGRARETVETISRGASPEERLRATIELASTLSPGQFAAWMDGGWFDFRRGFELTLFRKIIEERWRAEDPEGFVAWCLEEGENGPAWATSKPKGAALPILTDWALHDPDRLQAFLAQYPDHALESNLVTQLAQTDPAVALSHLTEMLKRHPGDTYRLQTAITEIARNSPEMLASALDDLPFALRFEAEKALVGERLKASFESEIRSLYDRPDGWKLFSSAFSGREDFGNQLLEELPNLPASWRQGLATGAFIWNQRKEAEKWFHADLEGAGFTEAQARGIRTAALRALTSHMPEKALDLIVDANLDESIRQSLLSNIFRNAPAEWVDRLDNEADQQVARNVLEQKSQTPESQSSSGYTPESWLEAASSSKGGTSSAWTLSNAMRQWDTEQLAQLTSEFSDLPAEQKDQVSEIVTQSGLPRRPAERDLFKTAIHHQIERELAAATETAPGDEPGSAVSPPRDSQVTQSASSMAVNWVQEDARAASTWVNSLPASEAKTWAQRNMAATWAQYDPGAMEQWLGTLPSDQQTDLRQFLENPGSR